jgi:hypothetical protein
MDHIIKALATCAIPHLLVLSTLALAILRLLSGLVQMLNGSVQGLPRQATHQPHMALPASWPLLALCPLQALWLLQAPWQLHAPALS